MTTAKMLDKASAAFKKQERQREGAKAMAEYQADLVAAQKKTEKLRALRLAREAADAEAALNAPKETKPKTRAKKAARSVAPALNDS